MKFKHSIQPDNKNLSYFQNPDLSFINISKGVKINSASYGKIL